MKKIMFLLGLGLQIAYGQGAKDSINTRIAKIDGNLYFIDCVNGFGGGNVTASIGDDGILLADDMYATMTGKLKTSLSTISTKPVRIVLNSHFHGDHIQGNFNFQKSAVIIAHENVSKRLIKNNSESYTPGLLFRY